MHTTHLQELFNLLAGSEQSGALILQPDTPTPSWQARFTLVQGQPTACVVSAVNTAPIKMEPMQAIAELSKQGTLQWKLEPTSLEHIQSRQEPHAPGGGAINIFPMQTHARSNVDATHRWHPMDRPCRIKTAPHPATEWGRLQRSIFGLIDGKRTVQEIAHILRKPLEDILPILQDLYLSGWIDNEQ